MLKNHEIFKTTLAGRELIVETGKLATLANGACLVRYGETVVHATACASAAPREGINFFPLSVDFEEKLYAVGKIPGSFSRREGRPSEHAVLSSRLIDRPIRPLFPSDLRNDVAVVCTVMSVDPDCSPEMAAMIGASIALSISDIPWHGPISGVNVGCVDGKFVINPTEQERKTSSLAVTVASSRGLVAMLEAGANQVDNETMLGAIRAGNTANQEVIAFIDSIVAKIGKEKFEYTPHKLDENLLESVRDFTEKRLETALFTTDKLEREKGVHEIFTEAVEKFAEFEPNSVSECLYQCQKEIARRWLLQENKRVDGRAMDKVRPLAAEVGLLPRAHGSGLFSRGQTQVLTAVTLGPMSDNQLLDGIDGEEQKHYMHHYNFPSFSVGETRPNRGPGRREIGHGALAERALLPVIPSSDDFPYTIRLVSEVLSSNGSTSQGAVCSSTLALMDAGVPISAPVAGISCGLVQEGDKFITMVDIQGLEDFFGDMDFKVAGTRAGITAIQVDMKVHGITDEIIAQALEKTRVARLKILDETMLPAIKEPRAELSKYAPKMMCMRIDVEKIRDVIGSGGKIVQKICSDFGVKVDIEDDGQIFVLAQNSKDCKRAIAAIEGIVREAKIGEIFTGKVTRIMDFGAFVELLPGKEGLCHVSQLDTKRTEKVTDAVKIGDEILVKVTGIDERGRINVSRREALLGAAPAKK